MKKILLQFSLFIPLVSTFAQIPADKFDFESDSILYTEEIVVTATRTENKVFDIPGSVIVMDGHTLQQHSITRLADALREIPEIAVQRTTLGGGSPILRGLVGRHVLVLIDGVRLNNSTYRSGPNQYFNTIDPNLVERIEIVNGPGSVLYGSDALGGIINIITKRSTGTKAFSLYSDTRLSSADKGLVQHFQTGYSKENIGITLGIGLKKFNDLRGGTSIGTQTPTGYDEWDGFLLLDYALSDQSDISLSFQSTDQIEVPRYDRIAAGKDIKNEYNPQKRHFAHLSFKHDFQNLLFRSLKVDASYHRQTEGSNIISQSNSGSEVRDRIQTYTLGLGATLNTIIGSNQLLTYGFEYYHDRIHSSRDTLNLNTNNTRSGSIPYPGDPVYESAALFIQDEIFLDRFMFVVGLRYSYFNFEADLTDHDELNSYGQINSHPEAFSGNLHLTYKVIPDHLNLYTGISQGFRAPNSNDLIAVGNVSNIGIEVPNPVLKPEQCIQYELGFKAGSEDWGFSGNGYYMALTDFISRQSYPEANGSITLVKENFSNARIVGIHLGGFLKLYHNWQLNTALSWTKGDDLADSVPLTMIPPLRGKFSIKNEWSKYWAEILTLFSAKQDRLSPLDILSPRIGPGGTPGFVVFTLRGGFKLSEHVGVSIGVDNILNKAYKIHGSGIYSAGRNLFFGLRFSY